MEGLEDRVGRFYAKNISSINKRFKVIESGFGIDLHRIYSNFFKVILAYKRYFSSDLV